MAKGRVVWTDLTVPNAVEVRDFYQGLFGWEPVGMDMGGYEDFTMTQDGDAVVAVCHAQGMNEGLPPVWLIYIEVDDLDASLADVERLGGEVLRQVSPAGDGGYALIRDPGGAVMALYKAASESEVGDQG